MGGWIDGPAYGWMYVSIVGLMDGWVDGWMYGWMDRWIDE